MKTGTLYIVPTPIGNLNDITLRALEVLRSVDVIAAEDTRHSSVLLNHFGIESKLWAVHEHNERQKAEAIVQRIQEGQSIALISDAGTPLISDPGYPLVNACRGAGVPVVALPGACAAITALSASGLPTDRFLFCGFLSPKQQARLSALQRLQDETATMVFYEAPRRILDTLAAVQEAFGPERQVVIGREITKQFETYLSGSVAEVLAMVTADSNQQRGEMVLMIAGAPAHDHSIPAEALQLLTLLNNELPPKKAAKIVASHYNLRANDLYKHTL
ncbi:Putative S-adenosylmethionine-dependent methyltransferase, YraL family [Idiomarina sp. A28L]|uniref:16S rRNA (cytidine(1402)-2'-O)-methyltransferase n=1 Tax=Idiomarina sp. A28L TaxID=1036674 RepID=UPI00021387B3|nr:16S rRNA (cytidine(1402)-2'-O)-methyltransferase [Idiomarina sp. A28L]EGN74851.1 Putative S-adenosylmethionine-dependent methyltransferase, YraL family [Idiomarina sp. A28L]